MARSRVAILARELPCVTSRAIRSCRPSREHERPTVVVGERIADKLLA
jgi:hypothetical protein